MIPIKIELENFFSYRQRTVLDFHGIHLACVAGPNGSGKSSLLDAITWVLFGRCRTRSDDNVVNKTAAALGKAAGVSLIFELGGVIYRVDRKKRAGKPMVLDFLVAAAGEGEWKSMAEGKLRATQGAIEQLLKMNYETFTNASFFLQDKADTFTTNSATHRKEILADLLGLDIWDSYKEKVRAKRREEEDQLLLIDSRLKDINLELAQEPIRKSALSAAIEELNAASEKLELQEQILRERRRVEKLIEGQKQHIDALDENIASFNESLLYLEGIKEERYLERVSFQRLLDDSESINAKYKAWKTASNEVQKWQKKSEQHSSIIERLRPVEIEFEREEARLTQRHTELERQANRVSELKNEQQAISANLEQARLKSDRIKKDLTELKDVEIQWKEGDAKLREMTSTRASIEKEVEFLNKEKKRFDDLIQEKLTVQNELNQASSEVDKAILDLKSIESFQVSLTFIKSEKESKLAEQKRLRKEMSDIEDAVKTLSESLSEVCPLCGQALSEEHRQKVLEKLHQDGKKLGDQYRENKDVISMKEQEARKLSADVKEKSRIEEELLNFQRRTASAQSRLEHIDKSIGQWHSVGAIRLQELEKTLEAEDYVNLKTTVSRLANKLVKKKDLEDERTKVNNEMLLKENRLAMIEEMVAEWQIADPVMSPSQEFEELAGKLERGEFAQEARAQIDLLNAEVEKIGYDQELHEIALGQLDSLSEAPERFQSLSTAETAVKHLDDNLADISGQIRSTREKKSQLSEQLAQAEKSLRTLSDDTKDLSVLESELQKRRDAQISAHRKVAMAQQNVDVLRDLKIKKDQVWGGREEKALLIQRINMLETAFGRAGVQSLLIERALPEIESDANLLLDRLTDGEMQVRFETQRKLKSSDRSVETLDIHISDTAGQRPYENYSGGEQFRINFAIRLALSKILTRRAGARLQTLVIDEGFGSQDPLGRQRLIEAINSIQDDFERILIITHIDELRDAFPTQIRVSKNTAGSTIVVV
ncbi:MAG: SMC family ATPase [Anaerolineae bacterium]|nr:MAG: SMC family ATPase [Anaerolineae bacterium]